MTVCCARLTCSCWWLFWLLAWQLPEPLQTQDQDLGPGNVIFLARILHHVFFLMQYKVSSFEVTVALFFRAQAEDGEYNYDDYSEARYYDNEYGT